jgi:hypothetical protein
MRKFQTVVLVLIASLVITTGIAQARRHPHHHKSLACQIAQHKVLQAELALQRAVAEGGDVAGAQLRLALARQSERRHC